MMRPVCKWAAQVESADRIPEYVAMAVRKMMTGRPGPVYLDLPADVAFELLRAAARSSRTKLHAIAAEVVASRVPPPALDQPVRDLSSGEGNGRWRRRGYNSSRSQPSP